VTTKLDEMWAALEAHKPKPEYAEAWATMLKERTYEAARAAYHAAPEGSASASAAEAAWDAVTETTLAASRADRYAQRAIDAIKEVKP
jgi:hypothetical protein